MKILKVFLDHLYFSFVTVLVGLGIVGLALAHLGGVSVSDHLWAGFFAWIGLSAALAGGLTFWTIRNRPRDDIVFTHRQR